MRYSSREKFSHYVDLFVLFIALFIFINNLFELSYGFRPYIYRLGMILITLFGFELVVQFLLQPSPKAYISKYWPHYIILAVLVYAYYRFSIVPRDARLFFIYSRLFLGAVEILLFIKFILQLGRLREIIGTFKVKPAQLIVVSFASIIIIGSFFLYLPYSRPAGTSMRYIDALFTSTSAVCVTGLIVVNTGAAFSRLGHGFLILLIQVGGIGIMTIAAFIQVSLGSTMSLYGRFQNATMLDQTNIRNLYTIIRAIVAITFIFESIGFLLFFSYFRTTRSSGLEAAFHSLFHSISAFCNAGFSLYGESFMGASSNVWANTVLVFLIVTGGFGFTVLLNLGRKITMGARERITVQSRIVLLSSLFFIFFGALGFYLFERDNILAGAGPPERFLASVFQSVTTRTAGFNTVDTSSLKPFTLFIMSILMFIGASPGSTGGGIKTTTFFVLLLSIVTIRREQRFNTIFKRRIPYQVVNRSFAIAVCALGLVVMGTLLLGLSEKFDFIQVFFETVSAFGTVGLSTGITPRLSDFGKIVIMVCMFSGRLGPLTLVIATRNVTSTRFVTYPEERIMVG
jgi:trk system potassium uptake protein TrkH